MCCYDDLRTTKIFEKLASFARLVGLFLLECIPSYSNYYFGHDLMHLFLYLFCVSSIHVKSFYGSRKTETIVTKIKIPNINISSDEDLSDESSPSIWYESTEWEEASASSSSESDVRLSLLLNLSLNNQEPRKNGLKNQYGNWEIWRKTNVRLPLPRLQIKTHLKTLWKILLMNFHSSIFYFLLIFWMI